MSQIPPWLQEQIQQFQKTQANLQAMAGQQQQLEMERISVEKAIEELAKTSDADSVYKQTGPILVKAAKSDVQSELEERLELAKTQAAVMEKQFARLKTTYQEQEAKIKAALQGGAAPPPGR